MPRRLRVKFRGYTLAANAGAFAASGIDATLTEAGGTTNLPPVWQTVPSLAVTQGGTSTPLTTYATDPEGQPLAFAIVSGSLPTGLTFNTTTGVFTATASLTAASYGPFVVSADDGGTAATPPTNVSAPTVSGIATVGQVISGSAGSWIGTAPISYTYSWLRNGSAISGATSTSYTLVSADVGATLVFRVLASNIAGTVPATSTAFGPVSAASSGGALPTVEIRSATGGASVPFAIGHVFKEGDVPAGQVANGTVSGLAAWQCSVLNAWPDGSAKFAILSGSAAISAGGSIIVQLAAGSAASGTALSTGDLQATSLNAQLGAGSFGTATFSGSDWLSPFRTNFTGPQCSSWTFRKQIGGDSHLVAWIEVRLWAGGYVECLPWIENGFINVSTPVAKAGRLTFVLNGTTRYDSINDPDYTSAYGVASVSSGVVSIAPRYRVVLVSGGKTTHCAGTDYGVSAKHDRAYFVSTKMVPAYHPAAVTESALAGQTSNYSPMRLAYTTAGMGGTGYAVDIGLLPQQAAMYLISGDARAYRATLMQGLSLASYAIHYRDEATNRPLLFASHPSRTLQDSTVAQPSGSGPHRYATSHHPAAAYLPYLISGWQWFVEAMQFQVTAHYLAINPGYRLNANYFFYPSAAGPDMNNQGGPRAHAWQFRTCAMVAAITPDSDTTMQAQFRTALGYNATRFRTLYETGIAPDDLWRPNALGGVEPGIPGAGELSGTNEGVIGIWQNDFFAAAAGLAWDLKVLSSTADLLWFRDFLYKSPVGRLGAEGNSTQWSYREAANYQINVGTRTGANGFTWAADWGAAYLLHFNRVNDTVRGTDLIGGNIGIGGFGFSTSYWGNLMPAIAYAVDHGAAGAAAAYARLVGASNWAANAAEWNDNPIWGVKPRTV